MACGQHGRRGQIVVQAVVKEPASEPVPVTTPNRPMAARHALAKRRNLNSVPHGNVQVCSL